MKFTTLIDLFEAAILKKIIFKNIHLITLPTTQSPNNEAWKLKIAFTKDFWGQRIKFSNLGKCDVNMWFHFKKSQPHLVTIYKHTLV